MKAIIQRVLEANVQVEGIKIAEIKIGALVLIGITHSDTENDCDWMAEKLLGLRIFNDDTGKMNHNILTANGTLLLVSQFTLYGECSKGKRPSFTTAAKAEFAEPLFNKFVEKIRSKHPQVQTGKFGADMKVHLINDGPVTLILESQKS